MWKSNTLDSYYLWEVSLMSRRLELHELLKEMFGSDNVYYQPPESLKISYPAIIYSKSTINKRMANDSAYNLNTRYEVIVVDKRPDNPVIEELLTLPYCSYDRHYTSDN